MRKSSKLAFLLALVLGMSTVFAACSDPNNDNSGPTPEQLEAEMNVQYKERLSKWLQYVEYEEPETVASPKLTQLTNKDTDTFATNVTAQTVTTVDNSVEGLTKTTQKVKAAESKEVILTLESLSYAEVNKRAQCVNYALSNVHASILQVQKTTYALRAPVAPETEVDPELETNYVATVTYSYYDAETGAVIAKDLEAPAVVDGSFIHIDDKTYAMNDEGIVKTFDYGMQYAIPTFDKDNQQKDAYLQGSDIIYDYDEYVYVEQDAYGYRIDEGEPITQLLSGDFTMSTFPSIDVNVYKAGDLVASYESKAYHIPGFAILPNGNVYFCEYHEVKDDAAKDIEVGGMKFDVVHTLLDVTTGTTSTLENGFVAQNVYTNLTKEIQTTLNVNTSNNATNVHLKDGYVLAEITKFENGALVGNSVFAVLDATTLEVVEELPKIVDSQFGYAGYASKAELVFMVRTADNQSLFYTADVETGDLNLQVKDASTVGKLEGNGILYNGTIYDPKWNKLEDMKNAEFVKVLPNGKLLYKDNRYSSYYNWYLGTLKDYGEMPEPDEEEFNKNPWLWEEYYQQMNNQQWGYKFESVQISLGESEYSNVTTATVNEEQGYFAISSVDGTYSTYFDFEGNKLFDTDETTKSETIREANDATKYVTYEVTTKYVVQSLSADEVVVVLTEAWVEQYRSGYELEEQPTVAKDGKTYYQYFTLK